MTEPQRIDTHHHVLPDFYREALERVGQAKSGGAGLPKWSEAGAVATMDRLGIAHAVASFSSPGIYFGNAAFAQDLARQCNDFLAELAGRNSRYRGLAILPLPDVDAALAELTRALDDLRLDGVILQASYGPQYLGDPAFEPVMAELHRRRAVAFLHPTTPPGSEGARLELPPFIVEFMFDTTRAVANLLFQGVFERYPGIRWIVAHAGAAAPYLLNRFAQAPELMPKLRERAPQPPEHYLRALRYDTASSTGEAPLHALNALVGPGQMLYGSDYPYLNDDLIRGDVERLRAFPEFDAAALAQIEAGNARQLFGLK